MHSYGGRNEKVYLCLMRNEGKRIKRIEERIISKEIIHENFPKVMKAINPQINK